MSIQQNSNSAPTYEQEPTPLLDTASPERFFGHHEIPTAHGEPTFRGMRDVSHKEALLCFAVVCFEQGVKKLRELSPL
jgi:hypothetical protein